jgi:putative methionine-R-sulfoxide reductase with GAF domain
MAAVAVDEQNAHGDCDSAVDSEDVSPMDDDGDVRRHNVAADNA